MRQSGEACDLVVAPRPLLGLPWHAPCPLRSAIAALHRADEAACVQGLFAVGRLTATEAAEAERGALALITALRRQRPGLTTALMREYDLSNPEGIRLMGLAEALLRIPDAATTDALIRDKLRGGDWRAHLGQGRPALNAATRGLDLASRMLGGHRASPPLARRHGAPCHAPGDRPHGGHLRLRPDHRHSP
jgi:RHH-type proline utilization regulon transcriptional repressor/proline dehydrogenase/delta 1-pyrroline-5-carboxylate dehydrogenase